MKKKLIIWTFMASTLLVTPLLTAQEPYVPFPKGNISWQSWGWPGGPNSPCVLSIDTELKEIDGKVYNKVLFGKYKGETTEIGGIREADKKIYFHVPELGEHVIYDFGLEIGDTLFYTMGAEFEFDDNNAVSIVFVELQEESRYFFVAKNKSTVLLENGETRNSINTLGVYGSDPYWHFYPVEWIEGIGLFGGFSFLHTLLHPDYRFDLLFVCVRHNNSIVLCSVGNCALCADQAIEDLGQQVGLAPNPTTGRLQITSDGLQAMSIEVFDVMGRSVGATLQASPDGTVIDISHAPAGIYFVKISTAKGISVKKIIKK